MWDDEYLKKNVRLRYDIRVLVDISLYEINESEEDEIWQDGISEDDVGSSNINSRISSKRSFGSYKFERTVGAFSVMSPEEGLSMINPAQTDWIILEAHNGLIRDFDDSAAAALLRKPKTVVSSPKNLLRNSRSNSIGSRGPTMLAEGSHGIQPSFSKERTDTEAKSSHGDLLAKKTKIVSYFKWSFIRYYKENRWKWKEDE